MVVYSSQENFREVAETIAAHRETQVVSAVDDLDESEPAVYVDPPQTIDEAILLDLQKRHVRHGPHEAKFSVVTGYTPEMAEELYFRDRGSGTNHTLFSSYPIGEYLSEEPLDVREGDAVTATNVKAAQSNERLASLCLLSGGWSMHLNLDEGFICGFPESVSPDDFDGPRAYCVQDGERNCPYEEELLTAEAIDADDVFIPSCASMLDNDFTGLPVHVGTGLLSSATTLIGSYRVSPSLPVEGLLHYSLLQEGYSLAHRCYVLNKNAEAINLKAYPYIPFGRPESTPPTRNSGEYSTDVTVEAGKAEVTLTDVDTHIVSITIPTHEIEWSDDYYLHLDEDERDLPLYYFITDEGDKLSVVAYSGGRIEAERLRFRVNPNPVRHEDRRALIESAVNATRLRSLKLLSTRKGVNQEENLFHEFYGLCKTLSSERYFVGEHDEIADAIGSVLHEANQIGSQVIDSVATNGYPMNTYAKRMLGANVRTSTHNCHVCGRPVLVREGVDVRGKSRRSVGVCSRCGPVYDVPTADDARADPYPKIEGEFVDSTSEKISASVSFQNPTDCRMYGKMQLNLSDFANTYTDPINPLRQEFCIERDERVELSFSVNTQHLEPNFYQSFAYIAGNNELYTGMTPFVTGDKIGFRY